MKLRDKFLLWSIFCISLGFFVIDSYAVFVKSTADDILVMNALVQHDFAVRQHEQFLDMRAAADALESYYEMPICYTTIGYPACVEEKNSGHWHQIGVSD